jgi:hypothetical protein
MHFIMINIIIKLKFHKLIIHIRLKTGEEDKMKYFIFVLITFTSLCRSNSQINLKIISVLLDIILVYILLYFF